MKKPGPIAFFPKMPIDELVKLMKSERDILSQVRSQTIFLKSGRGHDIHEEVEKQIAHIDKFLARMGYAPNFEGIK